MFRCPDMTVLYKSEADLYCITNRTTGVAHGLYSYQRDKASSPDPKGHASDDGWSIGMVGSLFYDAFSVTRLYSVNDRIVSE
jgi:hypothetical protein